MRFHAGAILPLVASAVMGYTAAPQPERASTRPPVTAALHHTIPSRPAARCFADFRPSLHGFKFTNRFTGSPLPVSLGGLEKYINVPNHFGLCGGMSFAAADYYLAHIDPPSDVNPPHKDDDLYTYLYSRQLDSLGESLAAVPEFARWMSLPDATPFGASFQTYAALGVVLQRIRNGEPCHLGLVLTSFRERGRLWENHQVLAYDFERIIPPDGDCTGLIISIYDPNFPSNDGAALHVNWRPSGLLVLGAGIFGGAGVNLLTIPCPGVEVIRRAPGRRDTPVRGFFPMTYAPRIPPRL